MRSTEHRALRTEDRRLRIEDSAQASYPLSSIVYIQYPVSPGRLLMRWALALLALFALVGCGSTGITRTTQTEHYKVQLTLDGTGFGERIATIEVSDLAGQPITADQVVLSPLMEVMGMASPEQIAQPIAPGRYQAKGEFFSMTGEWDANVRVTAGGTEETARFKVQVTA